MKRKIIPFNQDLYHYIEDEDKALDYLNESLPLVGEVVMYFNTLESDLDSFICEIISNRTQAPGMIVLEKLSYGAKVDLFKRFSDELHISLRAPSSYDGLIDQLNEMAKLRNLVVHADWANTDHEGYTFVRVKSVRSGMEQEYFQFSADSLKKIVNGLIQAHWHLSGYWEERSKILCHITSDENLLQVGNNLQ